LLNENDGLNPILPSKARFKRPLFIRFSFRRLSGRQQYISGIRFILEDYQEVTLGNIVAKNERMLDLGAEFYRLTGFIPAVGPGGIKALRAVTDKGDVSSWVGSWTENPKLSGYA
jgi:hypothetical protein